MCPQVSGRAHGPGSPAAMSASCSRRATAAKAHRERPSTEGAGSSKHKVRETWRVGAADGVLAALGVDVGPPRGTEKDFGPNTGTYVGVPLRRLDLRARRLARHVARVLVLSMAMYLPMPVIGPYTASVLSIGTAMALLGAAMPIATLQMMARPAQEAQAPARPLEGNERGGRHGNRGDNSRV